MRNRGTMSEHTFDETETDYTFRRGEAACCIGTGDMAASEGYASYKSSSLKSTAYPLSKNS